MSKPAFEFVIAQGVTLSELNPENNALKNEYADNLITTAMIILLDIWRRFNGIKITKGFVSSGKMYKEILPKTGRVKPTVYEKKHTLGLALEITWPDYDTDRALEYCKDFLKRTDQKVHFVIYNDRIGFYRRNNTQMLSRDLDGQFAIIMKK